MPKKKRTVPYKRELKLAMSLLEKSNEMVEQQSLIIEDACRQITFLESLLGNAAITGAKEPSATIIVDKDLHEHIRKLLHV
jgi:hypothetical protein